jgi:hypothetical protein
MRRLMVYRGGSDLSTSTKRYRSNANVVLV